MSEDEMWKEFYEKMKGDDTEEKKEHNLRYGQLLPFCLHRIRLSSPCCKLVGFSAELVEKLRAT